MFLGRGEYETLRGSRSGPAGAVHVMSASAGQARWVLAPQPVVEKANASTAVPDLLALLDRHGAVVSIDAMGGQKTIAHPIVEAGADYVLTLKDNYPTLCQDVQRWLDTEIEQGRRPSWETLQKGHRRLEVHRYALSAPIDWLEARPEWAGLQALGRGESARLIGDQTNTEGW